ncbi:uncharacterized protein E5676_scaffold98G00370 [Cucumis melo var. makuwa]|uniref:Uncharacterized protein n=1 Tax=Cucumis melo var. makuwa TaxID=1194695 RepID=A0A5D3C5C0_CUCMM|nr:uncharacterized protein E5676_scaffold98G00370 [Cucumis melo var. makuwa]
MKKEKNPAVLTFTAGKPPQPASSPLFCDPLSSNPMNKKLKAEIISAAIFQKKPTAAAPTNPLASATISSSSLFFSSKGSRGNLKRKNYSKIFPHYLNPFQTPARSSKSFSHHPHSTQFKYFEFSLPNSKVKFLKGSPSKTPLNQSNKKGEPFFDPPFSVSSEELEHLDRSTELESQKHFEPLETDLNALFQCEEEPGSAKFLFATRFCPRSCEIPNHLKSIVADCGIILI